MWALVSFEIGARKATLTNYLGLVIADCNTKNKDFIEFKLNKILLHCLLVGFLLILFMYV